MGREAGDARLYTSPLLRAHDTARAIAAGALGRLGIDPDLREISCGELEGRPVGEVERHFPALWQANMRQTDDDFRWPGGESYSELRRRALGCVARLAAVHPGEAIVLVTHAGVISQIVGALCGTAPARWSCHRPGNASVTTVLWRSGPRALVAFDDRAHLDGLGDDQLQDASARRTARAQA